MRYSLSSMKFAAAMLICLLSAGAGNPMRLNSPDVIWRKFEDLTKGSPEKPRLDAFAEQLRAEDGAVAYLVSYAGRVSCAHEALTRATRVRNYLVSRGRIDPARIKIIDAGHHDDWVVELWIAPRLAPPLTKELVSQTDGHLAKDQVTVLAKCVGGNRGQHSKRRRA